MPKSRICTVDGCNNPHKGYGYCQLHYRRFKKHGSPSSGGLPNARGEAENFFKEVVLTFQGEECLSWPYSKHPNGYGYVYYNGERHRVNRLACLLNHGKPSDPRMHAAHLCGNAWCCNPKHLNWKTVSGNQLDRVEHGTSNRGKAHWNVRLTEEQVLEIRRLLGSKTQQAIADQFGVHIVTINGIAKRRTWAWLE